MTFASIVILAVIYCFFDSDKERETVTQKNKPFDAKVYEIKRNK